jgi:hypothetical protein
MTQELESDLESRALEQDLPWMHEPLTNGPPEMAPAPTVGTGGAAETDTAPEHKPAIVCANNEADERVGLDIGDVLATSRMLEGKHLLVEVVDGEVYLHGTVADQTVKAQVELLSSSVPGARLIHNELDVLS